MSEKIKISISPTVAVYLRPGTSRETRLAGCEAAACMEPYERLTLLFCLSKDPDQAVRLLAVNHFEKLPEDVISSYTHSAKAHPHVLDAVLSILSVSATSAFIDDTVLLPGLPTDPLQLYHEELILPPEADYAETPDENSEPADEDPVDEKDEKYLSKYKISQQMGIGEKIKMALSGDKEWRSILIKDSNKLVSGSVVKNPRMTESEVLQLIKSGIQNDEIMRLICSNKEWIKSYKIRKGLIENNRTPVQNAMRYLATMGEKDLAGFAKSKNISSVVSTLAKRLLLSKKR